jgi:hypothetical protein
LLPFCYPISLAARLFTAARSASSTRAAASACIPGRSVPQAGRRYFDLGRGASYAAAARGEIPVIRIGRKIRVPVTALDRMLERAGEGGVQQRPASSEGFIGDTHKSCTHPTLAPLFRPVWKHCIHQGRCRISRLGCSPRTFDHRSS